jgi:hypothetical protein
MPDWTGHLIEMHQGGQKVAIGAFFRDGEEKRLESFEMPIATDAFGGPNQHELTVKPVGEDEIRLDVEIVHQCPITITDDGDNLNGIDWEAETQPVIVLMEGAARFTGPDGEVAYGYHERGVHRDALERPAGVGAAAASAA